VRLYRIFSLASSRMAFPAIHRAACESIAGSYMLLFQYFSGFDVPEVEVELCEHQVSFDCNVAEFFFYSKVCFFRKGLWQGDHIVPREQVHDVGVDDRVGVKSDVSEEMACFFVPEALYVLHQPISEFFSVEGVDDGFEGGFL